MKNQTENSEPKNSLAWLLYLSLILSGLLLLADAFDATYFNRLTARLGIGLLFTAFAFIVGAGHKKAPISVGILWGAIIATYFL